MQYAIANEVSIDAVASTEEAVLEQYRDATGDESEVTIYQITDESAQFVKEFGGADIAWDVEDGIIQNVRAI